MIKLFQVILICDKNTRGLLLHTQYAAIRTTFIEKPGSFSVYSDVLERILSFPSSVNFYMFHGGTNFGFMNGANVFTDYQPDVTSYGMKKR